MCKHRVWRQAVPEALPVTCKYLMQGAVAAVQVLIERSQVRAQVLASAGGPHQEAEGAFELFARQLLGASELFKLVA